MIGIIVLCRFNSSRLPGKILKEIDGKPILGHILDSLSVLDKSYQVVVCTSKEVSDDPIAQYCQKRGVSLFRGDLHNVALRFLECCKHFEFEKAVRINGDNLFVDPMLIEKVVAEMEEGGFEFASNVKGRTFPRGISVEAILVSIYDQMYPKFSDYDKEHVMTYFYNRIEGKNLFVMNDQVEGSAINLAIDTEQDFERAKKIFGQMNKSHTLYSYKDVVNFYNKLNL